VGAVIIPSTNRVTWQGNVGVVGGIPTYTVWTNLSASGDTTGATDRANLMALLAAAPHQSKIKLRAGQFYFNDRIDFSVTTNAVVIGGAGSGSQQTVLHMVEWPASIYMRTIFTEPPYTNSVALAANAAKGATTIEVAAVPSWIKVDHTYVLDQLDDPALVFAPGQELGFDYRHNIIFNLRTQAVTADSATDTFTSANHGLYEGAVIRLYGTAPTGLATDTEYFIRDVTANTFKICLTSGGAAVDISTDGSGLTWNLEEQRGLGFLVKVTGISGTTLTLQLPLYWNFSTAFRAELAEPGIDNTARRPLRRCGIEDLRIINDFNLGDSSTITQENTDECWVRNVAIENWNRTGVLGFSAYRSEIREVALLSTSTSDAGQGYGVALYVNSTACLVEDNIAQGAHLGYSVNYGSSGNVFAYNYEREPYAPGGAFALASHGTHCLMNLWEGNVTEGKFSADFTHGSASHHVIFRNYIKGTSSYTLAGNGTHLVNENDREPISIQVYNRYCSVVGNVLGDEDVSYDAYEYIASDPCTSLNAAIYVLGYWSSYGCNTGPGPNDDLAATGILRHLNFDVLTSTNSGVVLDATIADTTLPDSLYLAAQPGWWNEAVAWPPISPSMGSDLDAITIPAKVRYEALYQAAAYQQVKPRGAIMKNGARGGGQF
jgi:hypothetical protein